MTGYCKNCGRSSETHGLVCHINEHVPIVDQPEAYAKMREQADAALSRQLQPTAYERDQQALREGIGNARYVAENLSHRLDAALRRIEQLEREASIARKEAFGAARVGATLAAEGPTVLDCGCIGQCCGHQFSASPAAAYPPLPDEPTV